LGWRRRASLLEPRETLMTPLRLQMIEDMKSAGLAAATQTAADPASSARRRDMSRSLETILVFILIN